MTSAETMLHYITSGVATLTIAAAVVSMARGLFAIRAKSRFKILLNERKKLDKELARISLMLANKTLTMPQVKQVTREMEKNIRLLSPIDRALLEPDLAKNTPAGTERFAKEMLAKV